MPLLISNNIEYLLPFLCNLTATKLGKVVFATLLVYVLSNNGIGSSIWNFGITTHRYHLFDGHSFKQFRETINWFEIIWFWHIYSSFTELGKPRNKWQGKINFQTIFILEQQVLLFYFKFLEVQTSEISHRKCMDEGNFFLCVWKSTHVSLQLPILLLSTHIYPKF